MKVETLCEEKKFNFVTKSSINLDLSREIKEGSNDVLIISEKTMDSNTYINVMLNFQFLIDILPNFFA